MKINPDSLILSHTVLAGFIGSQTAGDPKDLERLLKTIITRMGHILNATPHTIKLLCGDSDFGSEAILRTLDSPDEGTSPLPVTLYLPSSPEDPLTSGDAHGHGAGLMELIRRSNEIRVISDTGPASGDYSISPVHEALIRDCDILIVASAGRPDEELFFTDILRFARLIGRSLFYINLSSGSVIEMRNNDRYLETLEHFNTYNKEKVDRSAFDATMQRYSEILTKKIIRSGIPSDVVRPLCKTILPSFVRANLLARHYHSLYRMTGNIVYSLSALAVFTITVQTLFFPHILWMVWLEVFEIAVIIVFLVGSRIGEWHRKWIDYRFLAERTRAAFFLCVICIRCHKPVSTTYSSLAHRPNDWMVLAFERILDMRPIEFCRLDIPFHALKTFLLNAWVDNRLNFYTVASDENYKKYNFYAYLGESIFFITLIIAVVHATGLEYTRPDLVPSFHFVLAMLTITLPAIGAALAAIRVQREYLKNSERYASIMRQLSSIRNQIHAAEDMKMLCGLLEEVNNLTMSEELDWSITFRFRDIEA
jgi:hypothetical protein